MLKDVRETLYLVEEAQKQCRRCPATYTTRNPRASKYCPACGEQRTAEVAARSVAKRQKARAMGRQTAKDLARCEAEQREIREREDVISDLCPAWLVTLGIEDWEAEKFLIVMEALT